MIDSTRKLIFFTNINLLRRCFDDFLFDFSTVFRDSQKMQQNSKQQVWTLQRELLVSAKRVKFSLKKNSQLFTNFRSKNSFFVFGITNYLSHFFLQHTSTKIMSRALKKIACHQLDAVLTTTWLPWCVIARAWCFQVDSKNVDSPTCWRLFPNARNSLRYDFSSFS